MTLSSSNKAIVLEAIRKGEIDAADLAFPNLIDDIILKMKSLGLTAQLADILGDKRKDNAVIPFEMMLILLITAKMKIKTSLTDVPFAINDAATLSEIGWNIWDNERGLEEGLMTEGAVRHFIGKYEADDLVNAYNRYIRDCVSTTMGVSPDIHILDCTKLEVELSNDRYQQSDVVKDGNTVSRGYKLATLRGIVGDTGVIEEIRIASIKTHDLTACEEMVKESAMLKPGDILINDRGFISRELLNFMKNQRNVDIYIPLKRNMEAYEQAVSLAIEANRWAKHPNKKRKTQEIAFVKQLGAYWIGEKPAEDVEINACVVRDQVGENTYEYYVFITTDLSVSARQILKTYELRPEIEEDYRQLKDFWEIEDFKSRKYHFIVFNVVMVLFGYLFFQLYRLGPEGKAYEGKSLPIALKNYVPVGAKGVVCYRDQYFGLFELLEFMDLYAGLDPTIRLRLRPVLKKV